MWLGYAWASSTARHPQTDGQTERTYRIVKDVLRHFVTPTTFDWDEHLNLVQLSIDNAWQEAIQKTPYFLNFGSHPRTPLTVRLPSRHLLSLLTSCRALLLELRSLHLLRSNVRKDPTIAALTLSTAQGRGYCSLEQLKVMSVGTAKLMPKWLHPLECTECIGLIP